MKVTAAVARGNAAPFTIEQLELDALRPNEVRVRLVATGICHTDVLVRDGVYPTPLPAVLGHEGAGVVEEVGISVVSVVPGITWCWPQHTVVTARAVAVGTWHIVKT
ncbi:alcohol dehydrogenase catalytic domain-containing protein [Arthrobacter alpinus]|nr:alcohol dehydrogenase catalytic domain-containing protein [Arthrobacter alpinus]